MGLIDFLKEVGAKAFSPANASEDMGAKIAEHLKSTGIPEADKVNIKVSGETATLSGEVSSQEVKEKIILAAGNVQGIAKVEDNITVSGAGGGGAAAPGASTEYYDVVSGDTLGKIAQKFYGNASDYTKIFEANKPMLKDPDHIYPGQKLRIPK